MSHSAPVTKQEFQGFVDEIRGELAALSAQLRPNAGAVQTVNLPAPPAQPRSERVVPLLIALIVLLMMALIASLSTASLQGQRVTDLRADMHAERASREAFDNWNAQEVTAIRSYITNGRLQPMQPRPKPEKSRE